MKLSVDLAACECHGQCEIVAPAVFKLENETNLVWDATPPEDTRADVETAVVMCPAQAITLTA